VRQRGFGFLSKGHTAGLLAIMCALIAYVGAASGQRRGGSADNAAQVGPADAWDTVSMDLTIAHATLAENGTPTGPQVPASHYHKQGTRTASGWRTVLTMAARDRPVVDTPAGPRQLPPGPRISRMEDDGDGSFPRFYDEHGKAVGPPSADLQQRVADLLRKRNPERSVPSFEPKRPASGLASAHWVENLVLTPSRRSARFEDLDRALGAAKGRVGRLTRYALTKDGTTNETLVDPDSGAPVEINIANGGRLVSHTGYSYSADPSGVILQTHIRQEQVASGASGTHVVTDVQTDNIRFSKRGGAR